MLENQTKIESKGKVMIVDDDMMHRKLIRTVLGSGNYDFVEISSGIDAIETFKTANFDLILMDLNMPGLNGLDAINQIKQLDKGIEIPIVMITAQSNLHYLIQGLDYGAIDYIVKPFNHDELRAKVKTVYKFSKQRLELANKQAELERLKLLQQTVVTLSHHINNAFSSISLSIQTIDYNNYEDVKGLTGLVQNQMSKVLAIIKGMQKMAQNSDIKLIDYPGSSSEMLDINIE
jgi:DNA-binding response OmpR family regulator